MASFRADAGLKTGASLHVLTARLAASALFVVLSASFVPALAEEPTLGTMPAGKTIVPGTVTTTTPDGRTTTRTLPADSTSPSAPARLGSGPQSITPPGFGVATAPVVEEGDPAAAAQAARPATSFPSGDNAPAAQSLRNISSVPGSIGAGISMGELGSVDASAAGLLGNDDGGLGADMWRGATRSNVDQFLAMMPVGTASPIANDLGRRLLLTSATPPEGASGGGSLLALRLDRLIASGRADLAAELGRGTLADTSAPVAVARARAALALADDKGACAELSNLPAGNDPAHDELDAFATRLSAFCQISSGNSAAANVTLDLAREEAYDNPLFYSLAAEANDGLKLKAPAPKSIDALDARFYKLAKRPLPDNAGTIAVPAVVKLMAADESLSPQVRIAAGERAASMGLLSGDALGKLYGLVKFSADDIEGAKAGLYPKESALRSALLYQAIAAEVLPTDRAGLMATYLSSSETAGVYRAGVEAIKPWLTGLEPSPLVASFAPAATRAFIMAGDRPNTLKWFALVNQGGPALGRDRRELTALMRVSDPDGLRPIDASLAAEIAADLKSGVAATQNFAATEAMIFDASGQVLPQIVLEALVSAPRSVGAPETLLNQLHSAGLRGSRGEAVLLSLVAIGPGGPESADRQAVAQSVSSLRAVHLDGEARRLAIEALLGRSHAGRG